MHSISGIPDKLCVSSAGDLVKSLNDDIAKLTVLRDELVAFQIAKVTLEQACAIKTEAEEYQASVKAELDTLKKESTEKLNKAKKREADASALHAENEAIRAALNAEKEGAQAEIDKMWDTLKSDIAQLQSDREEMIKQKEILQAGKDELNAKIAKLQATASSLVE